MEEKITRLKEIMCTNIVEYSGDTSVANRKEIMEDMEEKDDEEAKLVFDSIRQWYRELHPE